MVNANKRCLIRDFIFTSEIVARIDGRVLRFASLAQKRQQSGKATLSEAKEKGQRREAEWQVKLAYQFKETCPSEIKSIMQ